MVLNSLKKTPPLNGACKGYFIASKDNKNEQKWKSFHSIMGLWWRITIIVLSKSTAWWFCYGKERLSLNKCENYFFRVLVHQSRNLTGSKTPTRSQKAAGIQELILTTQMPSFFSCQSFMSCLLCIAI